jgi:hypothetical protein
MSSHARFSPASVAVVLAAGASLFLLATAQADPQAAAETWYLAFWSTAVLLCAAGLWRQPSFELAGSTLLLVLAGWVVPAGPVRASAFGLLLTASLGLAIFRRLADYSDGFDWSFWVPAALGVQLLARSDQLLANPMEPKTLFGLIVLPLAAAWSLGLIGRNRGVGPALLIAGVSLVLVPSWSVAVVLSLLGVALRVASPLGAARNWIRFLALALVVIVAGLWHPSLPVVILLTTLFVAGPQDWKGNAAVVLGTVIALVLLPGVRSWEESLLAAALILVLLPAAPLMGSEESRRVMPAALLVAFLAARTVPLPGALAAPLAAAALALPSSGTYSTLQRIWTGALVTGALLLAAYPWLRAEPLSDTLRLFGVGGDWSSVLGVLTGFLVIAWLVEMAQARKPRALLPAGAALVALAVAAFLQLPPAGVYSFGATPMVLTPTQHEIVQELETDVPVSSVVVDSYLENSAQLPTGTPFGEIKLETEDGSAQRWILRVGIESGEWAARRGDVASREGFVAPPVWLTWIPAGGEIFAQRYRARWNLPAPTRATRLSFTRLPELPPDVGVAILHLELRP